MNRLTPAWALVALLGFPLAAAPAPADSSIRAALAKQAADWNKGDLDSFVSAYAEDCLFVGSTVTRGRAATLARYRQHYRTAADRGSLSFSGIEVHPVDDHAAFVIGHFHLVRPASTQTANDGTFTLVWRESHGQWQIVLDHTAADPQKR